MLAKVIEMTAIAVNHRITELTCLIVIVDCVKTIDLKFGIRIITPTNKVAAIREPTAQPLLIRARITIAGKPKKTNPIKPNPMAIHSLGVNWNSRIPNLIVFMIVFYHTLSFDTSRYL